MCQALVFSDYPCYNELSYSKDSGEVNTFNYATEELSWGLKGNVV